MRSIVTILLTLFFFSLGAQTEQGLVAVIAFDDCTADESRGNAAILGVINGAPSCVCGVRGRAFRLDGIDDHFFIVGPVNSEFDTEDFTVSFYFKPLGAIGTQTILSKADSDCADENTFAVRYDATTRLLNVQVVETPAKSASIGRYAMPVGNCWQHIAVVRRNTRTRLYVNGQFVAESSAVSRVNLRNDGVLTIGKSFCPGVDRNFDGVIDELRIYNRALSDDDIENLFIPIDRIATPDSRIFVGQSVDVSVSNTCATAFRWTPAIGVAEPDSSSTSLSPSETTTYQLSFIDQGCTATDTIRVTVIDPTTLSCEEVFLPTAFTPNAFGPSANETFGISNPEIFVFGDAELLSFEIFDRWGNQVFNTTDANQRWDGNYRGEQLNPGVLLYKVRFICNGEEQLETGSVTLLR